MPTLLTMAEAARQLGICTKTLLEHVRHGEVAYISLGRGEVRKKRMFHPSDLEAFIARRREREPCQSTRTSGAPTTSSISKCEVYDITALRDAHLAEKRSRSRKTGGTSRESKR